MCGLFAVYSNNTDALNSTQLNSRGVGILKHRGPDREGIFSSRDGNVFLGHTLLSVSTATADEARQPVITDRSVMIYNGEIYNNRILRENLTARGISFAGDSDTETLVRGIEHLGWSFLDAVEGCWALVLYDLESRKLYFSRDPLGEKQLMYKVTGEGLTLASEAKAILTVQGQGTLNPERVFSDLIFDFFSNRETTYFQDIKNCLPGKVYQYDKHGKTPQVIYTSSLGATKPDSPLRRKLAHAVSSMVPGHHAHAVVLSGGLDSSIIATLLKNEMQNKPFVAVTAAYVGSENEDLRCAEYLVEYLGGINHQVLHIDREDIEQHFETVQRALEEPLHDQVYVTQYLIYKHIASLGLKVAFNGQGADEFWGGYYHHYNLQSLYATADDGAVIDHFLRISNKRGLHHSLTQQEIRNIIEQNLKPRWTNFGSLQNILMEGHLQAMISHEDKLSMASGVEVRLPFLNQALVMHALKMTSEEKIHQGIEKAPLRKAMNGVMPDMIRQRRKQAFPDAPRTAYLKVSALQALASANSFFSASDIKHISKTAPVMEWRMNAVNAFSGTVGRDY
ncbi:MAG: asparagine synthase (glutamine-hydrolyzing) [Pseudomonadaceae bacterium]|nr:asparagine synthase (glutamine-hydrolyzing) [Pseudomonadaceae bacterium]